VAKLFYFLSTDPVVLHQKQNHMRFKIHYFSHGVSSPGHDTQPGPALASAGPNLEHFCGAPLTGVQKFLRSMA